MGTVEEYWDGQRAESAHWLAEHGVQPYATQMPKDPGVPAYPWLPDWTPLTLEGGPWPVSFVASACGKYHALFNLDQLRRGVLGALKGQPDIRTPAQRRSDEWKAFQEAKKRWDK